MTPRDIRLLLLTILGLVALIWAGLWVRDYRADQARLAELETFTESVENRTTVSGELHDDFYERKADAANRAIAAQAKRKRANDITKDLSHENQAVADFLAAPVPDELRRADREARLSGGLEGGDRAREGAGRADRNRR